MPPPTVLWLLALGFAVGVLIALAEAETTGGPGPPGSGPPSRRAARIHR